MRFLLFGLILMGCVHEIYLPDGSKGYVVECRNSMMGCYARANRTCGNRGYKVVDEETLESAGSNIVVANNSTVGGGNGFRGNGYQKTMVFRCGGD